MSALAQIDTSEISGVVATFDYSKGYGYVKSDIDGSNILLHVTAVRSFGCNNIKAGDRVRCEVINRPRGPQVFRIISVEDHLLAGKGARWI